MRSALQGACDAKIVPAGIAGLIWLQMSSVGPSATLSEFRDDSEDSLSTTKISGLRAAQCRSEATQRSVCSSSGQFTRTTLRSATIISRGVAKALQMGFFFPLAFGA